MKRNTNTNTDGSTSVINTNKKLWHVKWLLSVGSALVVYSFIAVMGSSSVPGSNLDSRFTAHPFAFITALGVFCIVLAVGYVETKDKMTEL